KYTSAQGFLLQIIRIHIKEHMRDQSKTHLISGDELLEQEIREIVEKADLSGLPVITIPKIMILGIVIEN
ncbi:MAG: hypothetical protein ACI4LA_08990, partial [Emergencia sp.]